MNTPRVVRSALLGLPIGGLRPITLRQYLYLEEIGSPLCLHELKDEPGQFRLPVPSDLGALDAGRAWFILTRGRAEIEPVLYDMDGMDRAVIEAADGPAPMPDPLQLPVLLCALIDSAWQARGELVQPPTEGMMQSSEGSGIGDALMIAAEAGVEMGLKPDEALDESLARLFALDTAIGLMNGLQWKHSALSFARRETIDEEEYPEDADAFIAMHRANDQEPSSNAK